MNTSTCCPPLIVTTHRPLPLRWWLDLQSATRHAWRAHCERARVRAEWRSLRGLGDATLRDIGLADRQIEPGYTLGVLDSERSRWS